MDPPPLLPCHAMPCHAYRGAAFVNLRRVRQTLNGFSLAFRRQRPPPARETKVPVTLSEPVAATSAWARPVLFACVAIRRDPRSRSACPTQDATRTDKLSIRRRERRREPPQSSGNHLSRAACVQCERRGCGTESHPCCGAV